MPEIAAFVKHGSAFITPNILAKVLRELPLWKAQFSQINAPDHPHLVDQLMFLADVAEDFAEGAAKDLPFVTVAEAVFSLTYVHRGVGIIPDFVPNFGRADDSGIVRSVLIMNEKALAAYAASRGINWSRIADRP